MEPIVEIKKKIALQDFHLTTQIIFGPGALTKLPEVGREFGKRVLLVSGRGSLRSSGVIGLVLAQLQRAGFEVELFDAVEPEPSLEIVERGRKAARAARVEWVAGLGGGSAIDAAKAIAGLIHEPHAMPYYFKGGAIENAGLPLVVLPTTAGSGAEVTVNAVLSDTNSRIKQSIRDPRLAARVVIADPELTLTLPPEITAYTGMDALIQAIEAFTSIGSGPFTDIFAYGAIERIGANLLRAFQNGQDLPARTEMLLGSLMAGAALTNARLGAVHGMAHSIGIRTGKPHGLVCAALLIPVMRFNMPVSHEKYARVAQALGISTAGLDPIDAAAQAIKALMGLQRKLGLPSHLRDIGLAENDFPAVAAESMTSGSLKANPRPASESDLISILKEQF